LGQELVVVMLEQIHKLGNAAGKAHEATAVVHIIMKPVASGTTV
jgi:hypothetical protein